MMTDGFRELNLNSLCTQQFEFTQIDGLFRNAIFIRDLFPLNKSILAINMLYSGSFYISFSIFASILHQNRIKLFIVASFNQHNSMRPSTKHS